MSHARSSHPVASLSASQNEEPRERRRVAVVRPLGPERRRQHAGRPGRDGWASAAFGEADVERLWGYLRSFLRLDQPDPVAAWDEHIERLISRAAQMNERAFDALHYREPGTDLTVGFMPDSRWSAGEMNTNWGVTFRPNLPTEEIFTAPDRRRADGVVRSTRPLAIGGTIVRDLEVTFADGVVTDVKASTGAIGKSGIVFFDTLLDENATCHIAYGAGIPIALEEAADLSTEERL